MNRRKQVENIRKRNENLTQQLNELKQKLQDQPNPQDFISELEQIKDKWLKALHDLEKTREKYDSLISEIMEIKKIMRTTGFKIKIPWHKKIFLKIRKNIKN